MSGRRGRRTTFGGILSNVRAENSRRLMARAAIANRLAKSIGGRARARAYSVKHSALLRLSQRFPNEVTIHSDPYTPGFVVVIVQSCRFGLHAPAGHFEQGSSVAIAHRQRTGFGILRSFGEWPTSDVLGDEVISDHSALAA